MNPPAPVSSTFRKVPVPPFGRPPGLSVASKHSGAARPVRMSREQQFDYARGTGGIIEILAQGIEKNEQISAACVPEWRRGRLCKFPHEPDHRVLLLRRDFGEHRERQDSALV